MSAHEGCSKPDARIYETALQKLGITPGDVLFVDDWEDAVEGARRAGMQSVQLTAGAAPSAGVIGDLEDLLPLIG